MLTRAPLNIDFSRQAVKDIIGLYDNKDKNSGSAAADNCLLAFVKELKHLAKDSKKGRKLDSVMCGLLSHSCYSVTIYFVRSITTLKIIKVLNQGVSIEINDLEEARYT